MTDIFDLLEGDESTANATENKDLSGVDVNKKYKALDEREKILIRPSRYVGAIEPCTHEQWVYMDEMMKRHETTWNPAFLKLFDEIIMNSIDHSKTKEGNHMSEVRVTMDDESGMISVFDNGGIPIVKHDETGLYIPELIFGRMHAGSNFDDEEKSDRTGQNGEGSTLVNIFSTQFVVESADGKNSFKQVHSDNMSQRTEPQIAKTKKAYTRISWFVDPKYLKCTLADHDNKLKLIKRVYDCAACNAHLKFYLNDELVKFNKGFVDYMKLFDPNVISYVEDDWQVGFSPSARGDFEHISYVNGTASPQGGTHIDYIMDQVIDQIREHVRKKTKIDIMPGQIKNHMLLFVNAKVYNPRYDSQTKENLVTNVSDFGTTCKVPDSVIKKLIKSPIMESIMKWVEAKKIAEETKKLAEEQKKTAGRDIEKHIEAAGDVPLEKFIHFTEGDSAIGNFVDCRDPDIHGGYPLRGKVLNVREKNPIDIMQNTECADMMEIMGLTIGEPVDVSKLKYGYAVIMSDADPDGDCICGQLLNFFSLWPELFEQGRVLRLRTPMFIIHQNGKPDEWFYNRKAFNEWKAATGIEPKPSQIEYIKGLGELTEADYERCLKTHPVYQRFTLDDIGTKSLDLVFGKDPAPRKPWLLGE